MGGRSKSAANLMNVSKFQKSTIYEENSAADAKNVLTIDGLLYKHANKDWRIYLNKITNYNLKRCGEREM